MQKLPSEQGRLLLVYTHPWPGLQLSVVHKLPSSQLLVLGLQTPALHWSPSEQALPSSHGSVLLTWVHPVSCLQPSLVQGLLSLQFAGAPGVQFPSLQLSPTVQKLPSEQGFALLE